MFVVVVEDLRSEQTDKYLQNHDSDRKEVRDQNCKGVVEEEEDNREEEENEEYVKRTGEKMEKKTRRAVGGDDIMRR